MSDIDICNVYDYVSYQFEDNILSISWDIKNDEVHSFMIEEANPYSNEYDNTSLFSCMWVEELKKRISWKLGDKIYIKLKYVVKGNFRVIVSNEPMTGFIYEEIREDGYLYTAPFGEEFLPVLQKCNCVYNELLDQDIESYILK
jgi:hypothetical protein